MVIQVRERMLLLLVMLEQRHKGLLLLLLVISAGNSGQGIAGIASKTWLRIF